MTHVKFSGFIYIVVPLYPTEVNIENVPLFSKLLDKFIKITKPSL